MAALAAQCLENYQFPTGGKGRRGEVYHSGKGAQQGGQFRNPWSHPIRQSEGQGNWSCDCGYVVWPGKTACPKCKEPRPIGGGCEKPTGTQGQGSQESRAASQEEVTKQEVGTEGGTKEAAKAELARKRVHLKYIAKHIEDWPPALKDSHSLKALQAEAEELKTALMAEQPTDRQLLGAKEDVNAAKRRVMKAEGKRDKTAKDLTVAKDEVAAARAAHETAEAQLGRLETALKAMEVAKEEPSPSKEDRAILKRIHAVAAGNAGPPGGRAYLQAIAEIIPGHGPIESTPTGEAATDAQTSPGIPAAEAAPQGAGAGTAGGIASGAKQEGKGGAGPQGPGKQLVLGPAITEKQGGRKRDAEVVTGDLQLSQEAASAGTAMEDIENPFCQAVPGSMSQPSIQRPAGAELSQEEEAAWQTSLANGKKEGRRAAGKDPTGRSRSPERERSLGGLKSPPPIVGGTKEGGARAERQAVDDAADHKVPSEGEEETS
jgi:hypothetical protein